MRQAIISVLLTLLVCLLGACRRTNADIDSEDSQSGVADDPMPQLLSKVLGVPVEKLPNEINQYAVKAPRNAVDISKLGRIHTDVGYAVGITLRNGDQIGLRFLPLPEATAAVTGESLSKALGVGVEKLPNEVNQYWVRAPRKAVDISRLGRIHTDVGYAVGITLPNGQQIGLRFAESNSTKKPTAESLSKVLGVPVEKLPSEVNGYLIHAPRRAVDILQLGSIGNDTGDTVGITLTSGIQIILRFQQFDSHTQQPAPRDPQPR